MKMKLIYFCCLLKIIYGTNSVVAYPSKVEQLLSINDITSNRSVKATVEAIAEAVVAGATEVASNDDEVEYFLPKTSKPNHYDISLNLNLGPEEDNFNYLGYVGINITVFEKTKHLTLHSDSQRIIQNSSMLMHGSEKIDIINFTENKQNNFLILDLEKEIPPDDNYYLMIVFETGYFEQAGLIRKSYTLKNGEVKHMLATNFEPIYARRMIPCYDEPNLKATVRMIIFHPQEFKAISNTDIESYQPAPTLQNKMQTTFYKTPKISTYLIVLGVANFDALEDKNNDTKIRVWVKPDQLNKSQFALNVTRDGLKFFENLFQLKYSLTKLDSIVVPNFGAGGMENWGLIVYGDIILIDSKFDSVNSIMGAGELICHEVAHQWFGNLVTLDWWDYSWLNEGFAVHYSSVCGDKVLGNNSTYRFMYQHVVNHIHQMLAVDSDFGASKSLNQHVEQPYMIWQKFDNFAYHKGSAIVRFMAMNLPNFDQGIEIYLKNHQYDNVKPDDLFDSMDQAAQNISTVSTKTIMKNWIELPGYPLITFNITKRENISTVVIKQERFNRNPNSPVTDDSKWWIPISFATENHPYFDDIQRLEWISDTEDNITVYIEGIQNIWVLINIQSSVFCRVNYDIENWKRIIDYLKGPDFEKIHVLNRAQLIDDANNLAKARKLPEHIVLDLLSYLKQETDPIVHRAARSALITYHELLKNTTVYPQYRSFVDDIYGANQANDILKSPDIQDLAEKAADEFTSRGISGRDTFNDIAARIYTGSDMLEVRAAIGALGRSASALSQNRSEFLDEIEKRAESNKLVAKNFVEYKNFREVEEWLNKRY